MQEKVVGNGDMFQLLCKASSQKEGVDDADPRNKADSFGAGV